MSVKKCVLIIFIFIVDIDILDAEVVIKDRPFLLEEIDMGGLGMPLGKRMEPLSIPSIIINNLRIDVIHFGKHRGFNQNGGYISAIDITSGKEIWILKVYDIQYISKLEKDVQDIFIISMKKLEAQNIIEIIDEKKRRHLVNILTPQVVTTK